jgi:hypothetical protein
MKGCIVTHWSALQDYKFCRFEQATRAIENLDLLLEEMGCHWFLPHHEDMACRISCCSSWIYHNKMASSLVEKIHKILIYSWKEWLLALDFVPSIYNGSTLSQLVLIGKDCLRAISDTYLSPWKLLEAFSSPPGFLWVWKVLEALLPKRFGVCTPGQLAISVYCVIFASPGRFLKAVGRVNKVSYLIHLNGKSIHGSRSFMSHSPI